MFHILDSSNTSAQPHSHSKSDVKTHDKVEAILDTLQKDLSVIDINAELSLKCVVH
jgi:hypothetical protein